MFCYEYRSAYHIGCLLEEAVYVFMLVVAHDTSHPLMRINNGNNIFYISLWPNDIEIKLGISKTKWKKKKHQSISTY